MAEQKWQQFLERNSEIAKTHKKPPTLAQATQISRDRVMIICCADGRINPNEFFGLKTGEANVIRNAGGRASEAIRSLEIMGTIAPIGVVAVIHHTDCGGTFTTDDEIREKLSTRNPEHAHTIKDKVFGTFREIGVDESVRRDMEVVRAWKFLPENAKVLGYVYDIETGLVSEVGSTESKL